MTAGYAIVHADDVDDHYEGTDVPGEFRRLTSALGCEQLAVTLIRVPPHSDFEQGTGHTHEEIEELYLVTRGTLTMRLGDDIHEVRAGSVGPRRAEHPALAPQPRRRAGRDVGAVPAARPPRRDEDRRVLGGLARRRPAPLAGVATARRAASPRVGSMSNVESSRVISKRRRTVGLEIASARRPPRRVTLRRPVRRTLRPVESMNSTSVRSRTIAIASWEIASSRRCANSCAVLTVDLALHVDHVRAGVEALGGQFEVRDDRHGRAGRVRAQSHLPPRAPSRGMYRRVRGRNGSDARDPQAPHARGAASVGLRGLRGARRPGRRLRRRRARARGRGGLRGERHRAVRRERAVPPRELAPRGPALDAPAGPLDDLRPHRGDLHAVRAAGVRRRRRAARCSSRCGAARRAGWP